MCYTVNCSKHMPAVTLGITDRVVAAMIDLLPSICVGLTSRDLSVPPKLLGRFPFLRDISQVEGDQ
jgi:hypothetical protein